MKGNKYLNNFYCPFHSSEKLNMVCVDFLCPYKGLICSLCRGSCEGEHPHKGHESKILPFKFLIESLDANLYKKSDHANQYDEYRYIERLEAMKMQMLTNLKLTVEELSASIQKFEAEIMQEFEAHRTAILEKSTLMKSYKRMINRTLIHDVRKEQKFELISDIKSIVTHIKCIDTKDSHKYELSISGKENVASFMEKKEQIQMKCARISTLLPKILESKDIKFVEQILKDKPQIQTPQIETHIKSPQKKAKQQTNDLLFADNVSEPELKIPLISDLFGHKVNSDNMKDLFSKFPNKLPDPLAGNIGEFLGLSKKQIKTPAGEKKDVSATIHHPKKKLFSELNQFIKNKKEKTEEDCELIESKFAKKKKMIYMMEQSPKGEIQEPIFSSFLKSLSIKISKIGKAAKQTANSSPLLNNGFVFITEPLQKRKTITFRITKLQYEICIGIGFKQIVISNKYAFPNKQIGHGSYMISDKGKSYSHTNPQDNNVEKAFNFFEDGVISVQVINDQIHFKKQTQKKNQMHLNSTFVMNLSLTPADLKSASFCAYLTSKDDAVQLL